VFVDMSQQRFVLLDKDLAGSLGVVDTNICKHVLFQFSSNQVLRFDIIETTYSRNELAAVANLFRKWIGKKTVIFSSSLSLTVGERLCNLGCLFADVGLTVFT
jgi:hypothetical protein